MHVYACIYLYLSIELTFIEKKNTRISHLDPIDLTLLSREMEFLEENFLAFWGTLESSSRNLLKLMVQSPHFTKMKLRHDKTKSQN